MEEIELSSSNKNGEFTNGHGENQTRNVVNQDNHGSMGRLSFSAHMGGYEGITFADLFVDFRWLRYVIFAAGLQMPNESLTRGQRLWQIIVQVAIVGAVSTTIFGVSLGYDFSECDTASNKSQCFTWSWIACISQLATFFGSVMIHIVLLRVFKRHVLRPFMDIRIPSTHIIAIKRRVRFFGAANLTLLLLVGQIDIGSIGLALPFLPIPLQMYVLVCMLQVTSQAYRLQFHSYMESFSRMTPDDALLGYLALRTQLRLLSKHMQFGVICLFTGAASFSFMYYANYLAGLPIAANALPGTFYFLLLGLDAVECARCITRINDLSLEYLGSEITKKQYFTPASREQFMTDASHSPAEFTVFGFVIDRVVFNTVLAAAVPLLVGSVIA